MTAREYLATLKNMPPLPEPLLELLRSVAPELREQGIELVRAQEGDEALLQVLYDLQDGDASPLRVTLRSASLPHHIFRASVDRSDFRDGDLRGASLAGRTVRRSDFRAVQAQGTDLRALQAIEVDLRDADLSGADLRGADLGGAQMAGCRLTGALWDDQTTWPPDVDRSGSWRIGHTADLSSADLSGVDLSGVDLSGADLTGADLRGVNLSDAQLRGARLEGVQLQGATLLRTVFHYADLRGVSLQEAHTRGADFRGAALDTPPRWQPSRRPAKPQRSPRRRRSLPGEHRAFQCLAGMRLTDIDWTRADLRGADLRGARLCRVSLDHADLRGAILHGCQLNEVSLDGARLSEAQLPDALPAPPHARAMCTDEPDDWRALGDHEGGTLGALRRAWADWMDAVGPRLDLTRAAPLDLIESWDIHVRLAIRLGRARINTPIREGSHAWYTTVLRAALSNHPPHSPPGHQWLMPSANVQAWTPSMPLYLRAAASDTPLFPSSPLHTQSIWEARAWLWAGQISHLDLRSRTPPEIRHALLAPQAHPMLETLRVTDISALEPLTTGPARPSIRAIYLDTKTRDVTFPDISPGAPCLTRLDINLRQPQDAPGGQLTIPRLHLPHLQRLDVYRSLNPTHGRFGPVRRIILDDVHLPALIQSRLNAERVQGLSRALPQT